MRYSSGWKYNVFIIYRICMRFTDRCFLAHSTQIEGTVDKSARILADWRTTEAKAKKSSHSAARENEKLQDAMLDVR